MCFLSTAYFFDMTLASFRNVISKNPNAKLDSSSIDNPYTFYDKISVNFVNLNVPVCFS